MKSKTIYLLALICTISLLSSAKQAGKGCVSTCSLRKIHSAKPIQLPNVSKTSFDLAPLAWLF